LYRSQGDEQQAQAAFDLARATVRSLAGTLDDEMRAGFLAAEPVRCLLAAQPGEGFLKSS
jgi:hypothetical protein